VSDLRPRSRRSLRTPTIARHGRLKKSNPFATLTKVLASAIAVVLVSGVSVVGIAGLNLASASQPSVHLVSEKTAGPIPQIGAIDGGVNLLLVGSDSRQGQDPAFGDAEVESGVLNDVTMLMHISQDHTNVTVVSFPRDMFVSIPSCPDPNGGNFSSMSRQKINTTLSYGGLPCTVMTVEKLTGLSIPFAAEVQFGGVIEMSNAVGGVPVCVAEKIEDEYTGTFLDPGMHTLQGVDALQFLRTRHGVGDGSDLTRISNQQVFLSSLVRTIRSADTLSNPVKLYSLAKAALSNMTLSDSLANVDRMVSIAVALKNIDLNQIVFVQYPTGSTEGGVQPIESAADALNAALLADQPVTLTGTTGGSDVATTAPVDPAAPAATAAPAETATPAAPAAVLPEAVHGQTASQETCSNGRTLEDQ